MFYKDNTFPIFRIQNVNEKQNFKQDIFPHKLFFKTSDLVVPWLLEEARIKRRDGEGEIIKMEAQR